MPRGLPGFVGSAASIPSGRAGRAEQAERAEAKDGVSEGFPARRPVNAGQTQRVGRFPGIPRAPRPAIHAVSEGFPARRPVNAGQTQRVGRFPGIPRAPGPAIHGVSEGFPAHQGSRPGNSRRVGRFPGIPGLRARQFTPCRKVSRRVAPSTPAKPSVSEGFPAHHGSAPGNSRRVGRFPGIPGPSYAAPSTAATQPAGLPRSRSRSLGRLQHDRRPPRTPTRTLRRPTSPPPA